MQEHNENKKRISAPQAIGYMAFIAVLFLVCLLPVLGSFLGYEGKNLENRPLARMPALWAKQGPNLAFPKEFDDYFEDHFAFREEMVTSFHALTMGILRDTVNEKVDVGKDGMLFYADTRDDYLGRKLLSEREIGQIAVSLRLQMEYAHIMGARFAFTIAPNKNTIYPERMPDYYAPTGKMGNRERLEGALTKAGVPYVDLAEALTSARAEGVLLYHPEDTHWNAQGALIAYRAIIEAVFPGAYDPYTGAAFVKAPAYGGDLHNFVLPAIPGGNADVAFAGSLAYETEPTRPGRSVTIITNSAANKNRLYLYRDSFGDALLPYVSANVGRVVYDAQFPYNYAAWQDEEPEAAVIELAERNIPNLLKKAPNLPGVETTPKGGLVGETAATLACVTRNKNTMFLGAFEGAAYDPATDRVLVLVTREGASFSQAYEAFPILDEEFDLTGAALDDPVGISLTLPTLPKGAYDARVLFETPRGLYEWPDSLAFRLP